MQEALTTLRTSSVCDGFVKTVSLAKREDVHLSIGIFCGANTPLPAVRSRLANYMANQIDEWKCQMDLGQIPNLVLPRGISKT
jgi:hypothetical protein